MSRMLIVAIAGSFITACGTHQAPASKPSQAPPSILIPETLSSDTRICVLLDPWHYATQYACLTVGALRATIRTRALAQLERQP